MTAPGTTRRALLSAGLAAPFLGRASTAPARGASAGADPYRWVDPFIGTGGHGHTYPGAATPFGMVQLSPDTNDAGWDACSGYHLGDPSLLGFSHTHLSGTGIGDLMDVLLRPAMGPVRLSPGTLAHPEGSYRARFRHEDEHAVPGYYRVSLVDEAIDVELTATSRVGLHRYVFRAPGDAHILLDFEHGMRSSPGSATRIAWAELDLRPDGTLVGGRQVEQWANGRQVFFALRLSQPTTGVMFYADDLPVPGHGVRGTQLKCVLHLQNDGPTQELLVKVGLSFVDIEGAIANLDAEVPGWDFDAVRIAAERAWRAKLGVIEIEGATVAHLKTFYTALYHTMLSPTLFSDADGRYRGGDGQVHRLPAGQGQYTTYSLWDTYRAEHPLLSLVEGEHLPDILNSLVRMSVERPEAPPIWPLMGIETGCMIAHHSLPVLAEAALKEIAGFDAAAAWPAIRNALFISEDHGFEFYRAKGWIPCDKVDESASRTLEYAYDDWAAASLAERLGHRDDAQILRQRAGNWRNLFDRETQFVRPRLSSGAWAEPFAPNALGHSGRWRDFTECNAWQATFMVQHDPYGLIDAFGGDAPFLRKLDGLFDADPALPPDAPPDIAGLVGQYAHGNEPSHHVAYLYAYAGAHHATQQRVRMLLETMYGPGPGDIAGNEDCGQMSAWYVLSALGIYEVDPVSGIYVFGSPLFGRADVTLRNGARLVVRTIGNGRHSPFIRQVTWRGAAYQQSWMAHEDLMRGGELVFTMSRNPNPAFGRDPGHRPPDSRRSS